MVWIPVVRGSDQKADRKGREGMREGRKDIIM
jgi:hypothetical protein